MPAPTTNTDICNLALDMLAEAPIGDITDDRRIARWFNRNYDNAREVALRSNPWKFAIERVELTVEPTTPVFGWEHEYVLPADCLRALPLQWGGEYNAAALKYQFEGNKILINVSDTLQVRYIKDITDVTLMTSDFQLFLAASLAQRMAHWLTGKSNYAAIAKEAAQDALMNAYNTDAIEEAPEEAHDNDYLTIRGTHSDYYPRWGTGQ